MRTVVIGSSTAAGVGASSTGYSWFELLKKNNISDSMINLSVSGYTTFHFIHFDPTRTYPILPDTNRNIDAIVKLKPDYLIISITTNDVARGYSDSVYMANVRSIISQADTHNISVLITSTMLRGDLNLEKNMILLKIMKQLKTEYQDIFVDILTPLSFVEIPAINPSLFTSDKIHPNDAGHSIIFFLVDSLYRSKRSPLPVPPSRSYDSQLVLEQNYPNPFNSATIFRYSLPRETHVILKIYDLLGREIATLVDEGQSSGWKEKRWDARNISSGMYYFQLQTTESRITKSFLFVQ